MGNEQGRLLNYEGQPVQSAKDEKDYAELDQNHSDASVCSGESFAVIDKDTTASMACPNPLFSQPSAKPNRDASNGLVAKSSVQPNDTEVKTEGEASNGTSAHISGEERPRSAGHTQSIDELRRILGELQAFEKEDASHQEDTVRKEPQGDDKGK